MIPKVTKIINFIYFEPEFKIFSELVNAKVVFFLETIIFKTEYGKITLSKRVSKV